MQLGALVALAGAAAAAAVTRCDANNCLRQVRATNFPARPTSYDCSTYQTTYTTTTASSTVTVTAGQTTSRPTNPAMRTIPVYASGCGDDAAYRSACSCNGQPSTVVTYTYTPTTTAPTGPCETFVLRGSGPFADAALREPFSQYALIFMRPVSNGHKFVLQNGRLVDAYSRDPFAVSFTSQMDGITVVYRPSGLQSALSCTIDSLTRAVTCGQEDGGTSHIFEYAPSSGAVRFSPQVDDGYTAFTPIAEPAC